MFACRCANNTKILIKKCKLVLDRFFNSIVIVYILSNPFCTQKHLHGKQIRNVLLINNYNIKLTKRKTFLESKISKIRLLRHGNCILKITKITSKNLKIRNTIRHYFVDFTWKKKRLVIFRSYKVFRRRRIWFELPRHLWMHSCTLRCLWNTTELHPAISY